MTRAGAGNSFTHLREPRHPLANWRNKAMAEGVQRALKQAALHAAKSGDEMARERVRIVPLWQALAVLDGPDAHGHHRAPGKGQDDPPGDCSHLSPDGMLHMVEALVGSL